MSVLPFLACRPDTRPFRVGPVSLVVHPRSRGFTYIGLLVIIVVIGISLGAAGKYWQNVMLREKETELLYRGDQYRLAIEQYIAAVPGRRMYPQSVDDLLKDPRSPIGKRHLRRKYKDPMTGKNFILIKDAATRRIIGVRSRSELEPLKQAGFPEHQKNFADKKQYSDWQFVAAGIVIAQKPSGSPSGSTSGFSVFGSDSDSDSDSDSASDSEFVSVTGPGTGSGVPAGGTPGGSPPGWTPPGGQQPGGGPGSAPSGSIPPEFQQYLDSLKQQQSQ